jgi:hypothetical protein
MGSMKEAHRHPDEPRLDSHPSEEVYLVDRVSHSHPPGKDHADPANNHAEEQSPTEQVADIIYWLLYHGKRIIADAPDEDLSRFAPHHEELLLILSAFDDAGGSYDGVQAAHTIWRAVRRRWPELAAAVAGQDIRKATQAQQLIKLGIEAELFETSEGQAYARVPITSAHDTLSYDVIPLAERGSGFQPWLAWRFYEETLGHPSSAAMAQAMLWLRGQARYGQRVRDVHTRVAWSQDAIYLDLTNAAHQAITADGWEVDDHPPVYFRRAAGALPLPYPDDEGTLVNRHPPEERSFFRVPIGEKVEGRSCTGEPARRGERGALSRGLWGKGELSGGSGRCGPAVPPGVSANLL